MAPKVLVLVHPGSACGSADFNIGKFEARASRDALAHELGTWDGALFVIDGALSDELADYPALDNAINLALAKAAAAGRIAKRVMGDDPDQVDRVRELAALMGAAARRATFQVTGAWYDPADQEGCVNSVVNTLREMGCSAAASDDAIRIDAGQQDGDEADLAPVPATG